MKKIALLFNSPYLGGAERSIVHQSSLIQESRSFTFFIPQLEGHSSLLLEELIFQNFTEPQIIRVPYPLDLFAISRTGGSFNFFNTVNSMLNILLTLRSYNLKQYSHLWCNGNKIAAVIFLWATLFRYTGTLLWHFRDYPTVDSKFAWIWSFFKIKQSFSFCTIANSYSVHKRISQVLPSSHISHHTVYNPSGEQLINKKITNISTIGVVSMLAPWKGIHQIIIWSSLYEQQLIRLGITNINIYGADIYATNGEHQKYANDLQGLLKLFPSSILNFKGNQSPKDIYQTIDLLIHPVIEPEPFGRIIIEAFSTGIPVVSTALGGSSELAIHQQTALVFPCYDYATLFGQIQQLCTDSKLRDDLTLKAKVKAKEIEEQVNILKEII